ncbi:phospholipase D-like domain-containing protein [Parafrankia discariae]|uniref:phospholipase D-like domain-containing protein n=1 Tax=Parafrankia discariae TaxID=365528 RepID=UPI00039EC8E6|nr:phospholipase D-like domain-containing protein [Parafrankia discariae]
MSHAPHNIDTLTTAYFTRPTDLPFSSPLGETAPEQWAPLDLGPNDVEAFIDGLAYFTAVENEIDRLIAGPVGAGFFYCTAWWLGTVTTPATVRIRSVDKAIGKLAAAAGINLETEFTRNLGQDEFKLPSGTPLRSKLAQLIGRRVDVRILAWTSPFAPKYKPVADLLGSLTDLNLHTILSVDSLRRIYAAAQNKILLNTCAHPLGAAHAKMIVCGGANRLAAFTGGLDAAPGRMRPVPWALASPTRGWHDVAVRVQGPAAGAMYNFFRSLWNEQLKQPIDTFVIDDEPVPTHFADSPPVPAAPAPPAVVGPRQRVQVLRTVPQMNFSAAGPDRLGPSAAQRWLLTTAAGFRRGPITFAPDGIFEFHVALRKAISQATRYIFIADQAFTSQEVMGWLNSRLIQQPGLKVILVHGADPADPPSGLLNHAVNNFLLPHLPGAGGNPNNVIVCGWVGVTVHSKVVIIDDQWCAVGSANCMRRSHFTDIELSIAVLDEDEPGFAQRLRRDLWARYCGVPLQGESIAISYDDELTALLDLNRALGIWKPAWGSGAALPMAAHLLGSVQPYPLPMPVPTVAYSEAAYDAQDIDSRKVV